MHLSPGTGRCEYGIAWHCMTLWHCMKLQWLQPFRMSLVRFNLERPVMTHNFWSICCHRQCTENCPGPYWWSLFSWSCSSCLQLAITCLCDILWQSVCLAVRKPTQDFDGCARRYLPPRGIGRHGYSIAGQAQWASYHQDSDDNNYNERFLRLCFCIFIAKSKSYHCHQVGYKRIASSVLRAQALRDAVGSTVKKVWLWNLDAKGWSEHQWQHPSWACTACTACTVCTVCARTAEIIGALNSPVCCNSEVYGSAVELNTCSSSSHGRLLVPSWEKQRSLQGIFPLTKGPAMPC